MKLILKYLSIILAIFLVSVLLDATYVRGVYSLLIMGVVLLLVNLLVRPILLLVALPLNILTLGLFSFVVNTLTIMLADGFVRGVHMGGFLPSLLAAVVIVILNSLLIDMHKPSRRCRN